jgi:hypothetical protein
MAQEEFTKHKLIKNVRKSDNKYFSFYDTCFEYKMFESVEAKDNAGLFFVINENDLQNSNKDEVITITIAPPKIEDIICIDDKNIRLSKAMMIGEVNNE